MFNRHVKIKVMSTWIALLVAILATSSAIAAGKPLTLAIHPYLPAAEIYKRFEPLAARLEKAVDRPVHIKIGANYEEHIDAIGTGKVDLAFMGPAAYVAASSRHGQFPLLARFEVNGQPFLFGVIAVRKGSSLRTLKDLYNKRFAFGDPGSTMSHIVPRHMLVEAGLIDGLPNHYSFLGSHQNVAVGVLAGDYDAGAMKQEIFDKFQSRGLQALALTPGVPDHLFVARKNLPVKDIERLRKSLLTLSFTQDGRTIMMGLHKKLTALVPAKDEEYEQLRGIYTTIENIRKSEKK